MHKKPNIPRKNTINLALRSPAAGRIQRLILGLALIGLLASAVAKFGVVDQLARLRQAQAAYGSIQESSRKLAEALKDFSEVEFDYQTHAMDWLEADSPVDRLQVLELLEEELLARGQVSKVTVLGQVMQVDMSGMDLAQVSQMLLSLEQRDIVASVELNVAATGADGGDLLQFHLTILLQKGQVGT